MAALTAIQPVAAGVLSTGAAVSASDTISDSILGTRGAYLDITNAGASPDNVIVSDSGVTPANNPATTTAVVVTNGTSKVIYIAPSQLHPTNRVVTVTHSYTTTVTYKLYPVG